MAFLRNILFCLLDVTLQRYDISKFEKNAFFTKLAAVHMDIDIDINIDHLFPKNQYSAVLCRVLI